MYLNSIEIYKQHKINNPIYNIPNHISIRIKDNFPIYTYKNKEAILYEYDILNYYRSHSIIGNRNYRDSFTCFDLSIFFHTSAKKDNVYLIYQDEQNNELKMEIKDFFNLTIASSLNKEIINNKPFYKVEVFRNEIIKDFYISPAYHNNKLSSLELILTIFQK